MQQAISYKAWHPSPIQTTAASPARPMHIDDLARETVWKFTADNVLVVLGRKGCCMSTVVKRLLLCLGVNPAIYELEGEAEEGEVLAELRRREGDVKGADLQLPAVFIGGKLFGGLDRVMSTHISGELVPILKEAGALWL